MSVVGDRARRDLDLDRAAYVTALGDDALIAAQRMGEWIATAPQIEEDVALGNIALDLLGQARSLLTYAGSLLDPVRTEDELAYFRDERDFRNVQLVERGWGRERRDFGVAMARLLILSTYQHAFYSALASSTDETLAAIASKAVKEVDYHRDHATLWVVRLGDGTDESHARIQAALDEEWRYVDELFDGGWVSPALVESGVGVEPAGLRPTFDRRVADVLAEATLTVPEVTPAVTGGRRGVHTQQMGYLLAEMQHLARSHPGATW
jgi:ring-1,2-phenylacetyl-CoA epoxidase subunit PaaC